jgi:hypothetical protein
MIGEMPYIWAQPGGKALHRRHPAGMLQRQKAMGFPPVQGTVPDFPRMWIIARLARCR